MLTAHSAAAPRPAVTDPPPAAAAAAPLGAVWPYLLIAPTVVGAAFLLVVSAGPEHRDVLPALRCGELIRGGATWVGFANYRTVLDDPEFWTVVRRTLWWTGLNVVLIMVLGTLVSLMLIRLGRRMRLAVMSGLVLTWATPVIAATTIFQWLFQSRFGVVNWALVKLGFDSYRDYTWFAHGGSTFAILVIAGGLAVGAVRRADPLRRPDHHPGRAVRVGQDRRRGRVAVLPAGHLPDAAAAVRADHLAGGHLVLQGFTQVWVISEGGPNGATTTLPVYAFQIAQSLHKYDLGAAVSTLTVLILLAALVFNLRRMFRQEGALMTALTTGGAAPGPDHGAGRSCAGCR